MLDTSNTYQFGTNTKLDDLFREVFERIGILGNEQTPTHIYSAIMSANLELLSWPGLGLNLWLVQQHMFGLIANQPNYLLPRYTIRVLEAVTTQPVRLNTIGTAYSTAGGVPANCFDPLQTAGCVQTAPNGSIYWDYGADITTSILYVGILPLQLPNTASPTYTLTVDYSFDPSNPEGWTTAYRAPTQNYPLFQTTWFVIENAINARAWRIRETNGATLALQQIYFCQPSATRGNDRFLSPMSRADWMTIANKVGTLGFPSQYYFDQTINPVMKLWPVPGSPSLISPTNVLYTNYRYAQDVTEMFQNAEVPQKFYEALVSGLSARLALKFAPDKYTILKSDAMNAYKLAAQTDYENVTVRFTPDLTSYSPW